jgi:hypothetical protein
MEEAGPAGPEMGRMGGTAGLARGPGGEESHGCGPPGTGHRRAGP